MMGRLNLGQRLARLEAAARPAGLEPFDRPNPAAVRAAEDAYLEALGAGDPDPMGKAEARFLELTARNQVG